MKKVILFLLNLGLISYSINSIDNRILEQRISTRKGITEVIINVERQKRFASYEISGDIFSADEIVKKFNETNSKIAHNLILILPDANVFKGDLTKFSKSADNIQVFFANDDYGESYFTNRTIKKLKELKIDLNKYGIKVFVLNLTKEELENALVQTFDEDNLKNNALYIKIRKMIGE